jgi:hypothetical protein
VEGVRDGHVGIRRRCARAARCFRGHVLRQDLRPDLLEPAVVAIDLNPDIGRRPERLDERPHLAARQHPAGGTAIFQQLYGAGNIIDAVNQDISRPLFVVINNLDVGFFAQVITFVAVILIITYFVTSSDSGTLMITTLISMGKEEPPISYRIFWRLGEGAVAIVLLLAGGLKTLQTGPLAAGLPFSIIMFLMMYGMVKAFAVDPLVIEEELEEEAREILSLGVDQPGD